MTSSTTIGTKTGRARRTLGQLWQVPAFLLGVFACIGAVASAPWRHTPQWIAFDHQIQSMRDGLNQDADNGDVLVEQARAVLAKLPEFPARAGEVHFLVGSAYARQAPGKSQSKESWRRAAEHLEKSLAQGPRDADLPALRYRLGLALYHQNTELTRAVELISQSVETAGEPLEGYRALVDANLKLPRPNLDAALAANRRLLDLLPESPMAPMAQARLQYGELLLRTEKRAQAIQEFERINAKAPTALRVKARLLQARANEEDGNWAKAILIWQDLFKDAAHIDGGQAFLNYRLGWCFHELQPEPNYEENIRVWSEALKLGGTAGQAAGILLGKLRLSMGGEHTAKAISDWNQALEKVKQPDDFRNPYVAVSQVREMFDQAYRRFVQDREAEKAQAVAELYRRITPGVAADMRLAEAAEAYARQLADRIKDDPTLKDDAMLAQYRKAAQAYVNAAQARPAAERAEPLWRGAQCYLAARDIGQARQVLLLFTQTEMNENRLAAAWFTIGDLFRVEGNRADARKAFHKCIEYPNTAFACRSNYHIAEEEYEQNNFDRAETILLEVLRSNEVDRTYKEKAVFLMSSLLMTMENFEKAQVYLRECLRHYPANPERHLTSARLSESLQRLADKSLLQEKALRTQRQAETREEMRLQIDERLRHLRVQRVEFLDEAGKASLALAVELEKLSVEQKLNPQEQMLLRRAWIGVAECHFKKEEFNEAIRNFQSVQTKHRRTFESLYACSRICEAVQLMLPSAKAPDMLRGQALEAVHRAWDDLKELPAEHEIFTLHRVPTRAAWVQWTESMQIRMTAPPPRKEPASFP